MGGRKRKSEREKGGREKEEEDHGTCAGMGGGSLRPWSVAKGTGAVFGDVDVGLWGAHLGSLEVFSWAVVFWFKVPNHSHP